MKRFLPILCIALAGCLHAQTPTSTMATATQLANEASARIAADQAEATARANAIAAEATARAAADTAEAGTRAAADTTHTTNIATNAAAITAETNRATAAEEDISTLLDNAIAGMGASITTLEATRALEAGRTIDDSIVWESSSGTIAELMSRQAKALKAITGKAGWLTTPATTLESAATHAANTSNPHGVTAAQVGLGNANNTSDANKPVSTAQQAALDGKAGIAGAGIVDPAAFRTALEQGYQSKKDAMVINALDYGVIPNDGIDDTTALQAAVTAAANSTKPGVLTLPAGEIKLTAEVTIPGSIIMRGAGGLRTVVRQYTAGANGLVALQAHYHMGFEDFTLLGPDATTGDGQATGVGLLMDHKVYPGQYIGGPVHIKNMTLARWYCPLRVAQIHLLCENTRIGSYTKGVILVSTDVFLFHGCAIGAENELGPTVTTCTSITMLGATLDPPNVTSGGGNFAGTFLATEIGGAWRILETDDQAKVRFESCNVECGNSFSSGSDRLFAIKGGARVEVANCRFGIAFTSGASGTETTPTPASIFGCDATNAAASAKLTLRNNIIDSGSYYNVIKVVGDSYGDSYPQVSGTPINLKAYNAAGTLKATIPFYSASFISRDRVTMEYSVPPTHAASISRRGSLNIRQSDDGDSAAGDDIPTYTRKTRKKLAGVVQYGRDHMLPSMLAEVLVSSSTTTANGASATETALPAYTVPEGQLIGNGDNFRIEFRGTCVANANTKTLQYLYGGDSYASLTITDATATAWWLTVDVFGDSTSILRGSVHLIATDASGAIVVNKRVRVSKGGSDGDKAVSMKISSSSTSDITTEGWSLTWKNGAAKY
jgi:hypothetical protein